jgi:phosphatidylglycerol:prolipoprotein diacylglycerol transferase
MLNYPYFNPVAFNLWRFPVHWYGLMYLIGIFTAWGLGSWRAKQSWRGIDPDHVSNILFSGALGLLIGGRVGYMVFYDTGELLANPLSLFEVWNGGMAFHGGFIGALLGVWFYAWRTHLKFFVITDFFAPMVPIGLGAGRFGNFINGELWGKVTSSPVGMIFPTGGPLPRYPSQLLELFLEGIVLFFILWTFSRKKRPLMSVSALFLVGYAIFRFIAEFFREPDPQRGYLLWGWVTEGQLLSLPMLILGIILLARIYRQERQHENLP